jgi:hypothetical protein
MDAFNLGDDDIEQMMMLLHHRFSTIYSEAHGRIRDKSNVHRHVQ